MKAHYKVYSKFFGKATEGAKRGYDLSDFRKTHRATSKLWHVDGRPKVCIKGQIKDNGSLKDRKALCL